MGATLPMRWKFLNDVEIFIVYFIIYFNISMIFG